MPTYAERIGTVTAFAPGRVNLIGDHTDYTGGLVLPMAVGMGTTVTGRREGRRVTLQSDAAPGGEEDVARFDLPVDGPLQRRGWGRYAEAVAAEVRPASGFRGRVTSDLPIGAGLSSSAALEVAVALALGSSAPPRELARLCQEAEHRASGVPCGIMDQLTSVCGLDGHALLIDCADLSVRPVAVPEEAEFVVVHSGQPRRLAASAYAERSRSCHQAEALVGPLREAGAGDVERIGDPLLRARARHVVSENGRVRDFAAALAAGDLVACGRLMGESHRSLALDFAVSTDGLDALVSDLAGRPGVFGARLTGAGFGGCVVALTRPGALREGPGALGALHGLPGSHGAWTVRPSRGAYVNGG